MMPERADGFNEWPRDTQLELVPRFLGEQAAVGMLEERSGDSPSVFDLDEQVPAADTLKTYLREIRKAPLLTAEQEVELAKQIEAGALAGMVRRLQTDRAATLEYLRSDHERQKKPSKPTEEDIARLVLLADTAYASPENQALLIEAAAAGEAAKEQFITANLPLVVSLAKQYRGVGVEFLDLIQEGNFGLRRAVEKFDYTQGYKFSTYATIWIRKTLLDSLAEGRVISLPREVREQIQKMHNLQRGLTATLGREPTKDELAREMNLEPSELAELAAYGRSPRSLDAPVYPDSDESLHTFVQRADNNTTADSVVKSFLRDDLDRLLTNVLDERQIDVLRLRSQGVTQRRIADMYGICHQSAQRLEQTALKKLRAFEQTEALRVYLEDDA